uniref:Uncharacterized protein n=1 Tax=Helianthus annuus TaxID=4232 RepID=A0A251STZ5_HELAN
MYTYSGLTNGYKNHIAEKELTDETYSLDNATAMHNNKVVHLHPLESLFYGCCSLFQ